MRGVAPFLVVVASAACVDPLTTKPVTTPEWDVKNVKAYAETAAGLPPDATLAWDLVVAGDLVRWRECSSVDSCGSSERSRRADELLGVEHVGRTSVDGREVEVLRLSLAPKPTYVVPYAKPTQR